MEIDHTARPRMWYEEHYAAGSIKRNWCVVRDDLCVGMHLHIWATPESTYGGIEWHQGFPGEWGNSDKPDNAECWLLGCPCWHDGSSLWAEEHWIPLWQSGASNVRILEMLIQELERRAQKAKS